MEILLIIAILLVGVTIFFLLKRIKDQKKENELLKQQAILLSKRDLEFLEFAADMYVKYSIELKIHSKEQHEYLIAELDRVRKILEEKIKTMNYDEM